MSTKKSQKIAKKDEALVCLTEGKALRNMTDAVSFVVQGVTESKANKKGMWFLPHWRFKDEAMATRMMAVLTTTLHTVLGEHPTYMADIRADGWVAGERKLVMAWGVPVEDAEKAMKEIFG
jgi:hypothetical protein